MILTRRLFRVVAPIVHVPISMFAAAAAVGVPAVGVIVVAATVVVGRPMLGSLSLLCILPPAGFVGSNLLPEIVAGSTGAAEVFVLNKIFPISMSVPVSDPNRFSIKIHSKLLLNFIIRSSFLDHLPDVIC